MEEVERGSQSMTPPPSVSCGLRTGPSPFQSPGEVSNRQQLDELSRERPGTSRIKKRLSVLNSERQASKQWEEALRTGHTPDGLNEPGSKASEDRDSYGTPPSAQQAIGDPVSERSPVESSTPIISSDADLSPSKRELTEKEKALEGLRWNRALGALHINVKGKWSVEEVQAEAALLAEREKRLEMEDSQESLTHEVGRLSELLEKTQVEEREKREKVSY